MKRLGAFAVICAITLAAPPADAETLQLRNSMRTLETLQDKVAHGNAAALDTQQKLMRQLETDIAGASTEMLSDPHSLTALCIYLLSGGNPNIVERKTSAVALDAAQKNLLNGTLAYARGDKTNANKLLQKVDEKTLPSDLGGRLALVKAILVSGDDLKQAVDYLHWAVVAMPGTLVEEGALRRCVMFAGKLHDALAFTRCSQRYIRRFATSLYWKDFIESFTLAVPLLDQAEARIQLSRLQTIIDPLPSALRLSLLLEISQSAVLRGRFALAKATAQAAADLSLAESGNMARATLYLGAAEIVSGEFDKGTATLASVSPGKLEPADLALLHQAQNLTSQITEKPAISAEAALQMVPPDQRDLGVSGEYVALVTRARTLLAEVQK
jgi:chemotaxis protein MotC